MIRAAAAALLALSPGAASAHKVIAGVFPSGDAIEGEIGFSNGAAAAGQTVIVTGPDGRELGRVQTDADGFFVYVPARAAALTFRADLGAGHVAEATMPAAEVAAIVGAPAPAPAPAPAQAAAATLPPSLSAQDRAAIAAAVRDEIRPLRREIAAYRERNDLQSVLGGAGYIAGLFGLAFYLAARRRLQGDP